MVVRVRGAGRVQNLHQARKLGENVDLVLDPFKEQFLMPRADKLSVDAVRARVNKKWKTQPSRRSALRCIRSAFRIAVYEFKLLSPRACYALGSAILASSKVRAANQCQPANVCESRS
ncbi:MAG: hypothetical protein JWN70_6478 [Planctomycetaceae bacterium]|nr:hypothetical protein [Planctomycetaceae bacterium]